MSSKLIRRVAILVAVAALLAGGAIAAFGATGAKSHDHHHHGQHARAHLLASAAGYLGIPAKQLRKDLRSGESLAQVAAATPGKSEAGLLAALHSAETARISSLADQRLQALVKRTHAARPSSAALRKVVTGYLGLTRSALRQKLAGGHSLDQVAAQTKGRSAAGLAAAITSARRSQLEAAVSSGSLSSKGEQARLKRLQGAVARFLSRSRHARKAAEASAKHTSG